MKHLKPTLIRTLPGPYEVVRGTSGTEETYEVVSSVNGQTIAWTFFWDAAVWCEMQTTAVTFALNHKYFSKKAWPKDTSLLIIFFRLFPGPFAHRKFDCYLADREVYCKTTGQHVVAIDDTALIARSVVTALNKASAKAKEVLYA